MLRGGAARGEPQRATVNSSNGHRARTTGLAGTSVKCGRLATVGAGRHRCPNCERGSSLTALILPTDLVDRVPALNTSSHAERVAAAVAWRLLPRFLKLRCLEEWVACVRDEYLWDSSLNGPYRAEGVCTQPEPRASSLRSVGLGYLNGPFGAEDIQLCRGDVKRSPLTLPSPCVRIRPGRGCFGRVLRQMRNFKTHASGYYSLRPRQGSIRTIGCTGVKEA
jgi:hypothetical protein